MLLKVGEIAARTGLTVRTLHHYDAIGLLKPSARSDAGYRLYDRSDAARLHAIQSMRHLGLPLGEIAGMLDGAGNTLPSIIARQIQSIDHDIRQAQGLREQLVLLQGRFAAGGEPAMDDWLATLARMGTYGKYFSTAELKRIFDNKKRVDPAWERLTAEVQSAMARGLPVESPEVQPLAYRWLNLMMDWMGGDFDLLERWGLMYRSEPSVYCGQSPPSEVIHYIHAALELRKTALLRHLTLAELHRFRPMPEAAWQQLMQQACEQQARDAPLDSPAARQLVTTWVHLLDELVNHDRDVCARMLVANRLEPLLQPATPTDKSAHAYLWQALRAQGHPLGVAAGAGVPAREQRAGKKPDSRKSAQESTHEPLDPHTA